MINRIVLLIASLLLFLPQASLKAQDDTLRTYIFGHSLINHELQVNPTPSQETSVPHWFHFLAREAGYGYAVSGQYGFIPQHANLPPVAQWGFDSVPAAWIDWQMPFSGADFDNILITPGNFIQWQGPTVNYWNDTASPLDYTNTIFNWVNAQEDSLHLYVYENWPDMAPYLANGFPATQTEWANYNNYLNGAFHDWFIEYHDSLRLAHPNHCVSMIPTGPAISGLLSQSPFDQIAIDTLYEDDAPHGRPTIYFLAALVTYMAMYEEQAPLSYAVPAIIDPIVANNYSAAVNYLWTYLQNFDDSTGNSRVFCNEPVLLSADEGGNEQGEIVAPDPVDEVVMYPNPTSGQLSIQSGFDDYVVQVFDLTGKVFRLPAASQHTVNLTPLPDGLYLVRLTDRATGKSVTKRIIKRGI